MTVVLLFMVNDNVENMTLNEVYKKRVNKMITEEYGISNTLHGDIIPRFQKELKSAIKHSCLGNKNGIDCKCGRFVFNCNDKNNTKFTTFWTVYYFKDITEYREYVQNHHMLNGLIYEFKILNISIIYIAGKPFNNSFYDTIGHELEHVYQNALMGKEFGNFDVYRIATSNINSTNNCDKCLAWIIYASTKSEQEAMINGVYNEFKNGNINPFKIDNDIKQTECAKWLENLYKSYVFLKNNKNNPELSKAIREYKEIKDYYNYKYFLYIARNGIKNFERRIARLIFKIKQTIYNHSEPTTLNEGFDLLNNYYLIQDI